MAEVIWLAPDGAPPEGGDWVLLVQDVDGGYVGSGSVGGSREATFYLPYPQSEPDQTIALAKAHAWADKHGVAHIYIVMR
jgi:hypothetical protein